MGKELGPPSGRTRAHSRVWRDILRDRELYLFLSPAIAYFVVMKYIPMYGVQIAFRQFSGALGILRSPWVGLQHFQAFFRSYFFWPLVWNTLSLSLYSLAAGFPIPIVFALMLNEVSARGYKRLVQTVTYAPHFISVVVLVGMIIVFLAPTTGIVNHIVAALGGQRLNYMADPRLFRHIYVWSGVWQNMGWGSIIYLAALSSVDPELHEAAVMDGASRLRRIFSINVPSILPTVVILFILNAGNVMSVGFEKVFLMQNQMNMETADVIATYVYRRGLINAEYSFSAAVGLFNSAINFLLLVGVNGMARRLGETSVW